MVSMDGCLDCQVSNAFKILDKVKINGIEKNELKDQISKVAAKFISDKNPLELSFEIYSLLKRYTNVVEYFKNEKKLTNDIAKSFLNQINDIDESKDPLFEKITYSIFGNIIDYGIAEQREKDFNQEFKNLEKYSFGINHYKELLVDLNKAKTLVYLTDNSGEIIFDLHLIEHLNETFPKIDIKMVVRSSDILNDVTLSDVRDLGYKGEVIKSGSSFPGIMVDHIDETTLELIRDADIVLSKGQGNFEGLYNVKSADFNIYFVFVVKCEIIAKLINVDKGSLMLMKQNIESV